MARCKWGNLKSPHGRRRCKKPPRGGSRRKVRRTRRSARRSTRRGVRCRFGRLKHPKNGRVCRRVRRGVIRFGRKQGYYKKQKLEGPRRQDGSY